MTHQKTKNSIKLESGDWSAVIDLTHGANCISLRNKKYNAKLLREPPTSHELDNPYLYGMPILFSVNRIENGSFEFEGRHYHGQGIMSITDIDKRLRIVYENDEKYGFRLIYNGGSDGYNCPVYEMLGGKCRDKIRM